MTEENKRGQRTTRGTRKTPGSRPSRKRVPMTGERLRLFVDECFKDPGYFYKWFNDDGDLIYRALQAGFEFVNDPELEVGERRIDTAGDYEGAICQRVGQGTTAYLMRQPMEWYEEDRALRDAKVDRNEEALLRKLNDGKDGTYGKFEVSRK